MRGSLLTLLVAAAMVVAPAAHAQQTGDGMFRYTVQPGDTLSGLTRSFLVGDYQTLQKLNKVADPYNLPIGSILLIPEAMLRTVPLVGRVSSFRGAVTIDGHQAALAEEVRQGMRIETGPSASVTISLPDGSAIALPSQSRIFVSRLRNVLLTGGIQRTFSLEAGRSRSTVSPIKDPNSDFRVTTPLSVAAVRGTDFRVALDETGDRALTEVVGGTVGVASGAETDETAVPKGFGVVSTPSGTEPPMPLLPAPKLLAIERTDNGVAITGELVDGAAKYRIQLATDLAFLDVIDEVISDKPSTTFVLPANSTFFVRLTAIAPSGMEGLPGTYAPGLRTSGIEPGGADGKAATAAVPSASNHFSMTNHGAGAKQSILLRPPLR